MPASTLSTDEVTERVIALVADMIEGQPQLTPATDFVADLNFDSLERMELAMQVEEVYDIAIPDEQAEEARTIGDVVRLVLAQAG